MQNLFSMLSRAKARFLQSDEEVQLLREELNNIKLQNKKAKIISAELQKSVADLKVKVKEISAINEIILNVQQSLLEELSFASQYQQKKSGLTLFPIGNTGNDDDDLPN